jgi:hypothetical protein
MSSIFIMETFGDSIVASKSQHCYDLVGPSGESVAQLHQLRQAGLARKVMQ